MRGEVLLQQALAHLQRTFGHALPIEGEDVEEAEPEVRSGQQRLGLLPQQHADGVEGQHFARVVAHHQLTIQNEAVREVLRGMGEERGDGRFERAQALWLRRVAERDLTGAAEECHAVVGAVELDANTVEFVLCEVGRALGECDCGVEGRER